MGVSTEQGEITVTQGEREGHFWILGSTGQGKSRFLSHLIRRDIDRLRDDQKKGVDPRKGRACSLCFIDSTPNGQNAYDILNYCAQVGFKKVFVVDPALITLGRVPPINPLNYHKSYIVDSVDYLRDAFRILFEVEDDSRTAYITGYLTAVFTLLHHAGLTLRDLIYFTLPFDKNPDEFVPEWGMISQEYQRRRQEIFEKVREKMERPEFLQQEKEIVLRHLAEIQRAFKNQVNFANEFGSTARRINVLVNNPNLSLIFGHRKGVSFDKLITEGWVILVNASARGMGTLQSRLLVTVIVNQITQTIERLRGDAPFGHGFNKPYYLYLDEAQKYGTEKLYDVLDTKRNIKLRLILANHFPAQFKPRLLKSIRDNTHVKVAFWVGGKDDRLDVANEFYGGKLKEEDVEFVLSQKEKREAVVKVGKDGAVTIKTHDTPNAPLHKEFLDKLIATNNYASVDEVLKDFDARYQNIQPRPKTNPRLPERGKASDRPPDNQTAQGESAFKRAKPKGL